MLTFNLLAGWTVMGKTLFDWLDFLTSRWMMPLGGILVALLAAMRCLKKFQAASVSGSSTTPQRRA